MKTHTPAPWLRAGQNALRDEVTGPDESRLVASVFVRQFIDVSPTAAHALSWPEGEANMALILAAPDLLALARKLASECAECGVDDTMHEDGCPDCADIRAVIAKAEGRA